MIKNQVSRFLEETVYCTKQSPRKHSVFQQSNTHLSQTFRICMWVFTQIILCNTQCKISCKFYRNN